MRHLWAVLFVSTLSGCGLISSKTSGLLDKAPDAATAAEQDPSPQGPSKRNGDDEAADDADKGKQNQARHEEEYQAFHSGLGKIRGTKDTLELMALIDKKPDTVKPSLGTMGPGTGYRKRLEEIGAIAAFADFCKENGGFAKLTTKDRMNPGEPVPAEACDLAARRQAILAAYIRLEVEAGVKSLSERAEKVIQAAAKGEAITAEWHSHMKDREAFVAYVTQVYQEPAEKLGGKVEPGWLAGLAALEAKYTAALDEASKTNRWDAAAKIEDKATTDYFRGFHRGTDGTVEAKVLKVAAYDDWSVTKEFGLPVARDRRVQVMIQAKGEDYCRVYGVNVNSKYNSGWGAPYTIGGGANIRISSCK